MAIRINPNDKTLSLEWQGDFELNQNGGLALASGWEQIRQRIIRRLLTSPRMILQDGTPVTAEYIFDQNYGLGFRRKIGENFTPDLKARMRADIMQAVLTDEGVDVNQPPIIDFKFFADHSLQIQIAIALKTGRRGVITLEISG